MALNTQVARIEWTGIVASSGKTIKRSETVSQRHLEGVLKRHAALGREVTVTIIEDTFAASLISTQEL